VLKSGQEKLSLAGEKDCGHGKRSKREKGKESQVVGTAGYILFFQFRRKRGATKGKERF